MKIPTNKKERDTKDQSFQRPTKPPFCPLLQCLSTFSSLCLIKIYNYWSFRLIDLLLKNSVNNWKHGWSIFVMILQINPFSFKLPSLIRNLKKVSFSKILNLELFFFRKFHKPVFLLLIIYFKMISIFSVL